MKGIYKVTNQKNQSAWIGGRLQTQYKVGEWVKPPIGKSFLFDNFETAKRFADDYYGKVYSVKIRGYEKIECFFWESHNQIPYLDRLKDWWEKRKGYSRYLLPIPANTVFASKVMLLKEVYNAQRDRLES